MTDLTFDAYRIVAVANIENKPNSWCFTDIAAAGALGRIIDGPIESWQDIERAESALRAILLFDFVDVLVPCAKGEYDSGLIGYIRFDKQHRNAASFDAFQVAPCRDLLLATEFLNITQGKITGSSNENSNLIGRNIEAAENNFNTVAKNAAKIASALPMTIGASTCFTSKVFSISEEQGVAGFIDELYRRIYYPWMNIAQKAPTLFADVKLPPLITIVLNRAPSRQSIPNVLKELREELESVRSDLNRMNMMLEKSTLTQAEIHSQVKKLTRVLTQLLQSLC